jgi:hypothetical protein
MGEGAAAAACNDIYDDWLSVSNVDDDITHDDAH